MHRILLFIPMCFLPGVLAAQSHAGHSASPYVEFENREIKALAADEIAGLIAGEGMGFALAAELNAYPGPRHVLDMADSLELTVDQRKLMEAIRERMGDEARMLGGRLIDAERDLDRSFANGTIDEDGLLEAVRAIADLRGELRAVHLLAHLRTMDVLSVHQRHRYQELRGYAGRHDAPAGLEPFTRPGLPSIGGAG